MTKEKTGLIDGYFIDGLMANGLLEIMSMQGLLEEG